MRTLLLLLLATPGAAFELSPPVACVLGQACYIQQGFDHDPGPGARDALCGTLVYDGHDGTDFAVPTLADRAAGVAVVASAAGRVRAVRDGEPDIPQGRPDSPDVSGRECGNGVVLDHGGGWETQYCHLERGSVAVAPGDEVATGQVLGRIGLSGNTEFPHVELTVRRDGEAVDPFAPDASGACGVRPAEDLWAGDLPFPLGGVTDAGFATAVPDYGAVRAGTADAAPSASEPLVLFALLFGGQAGDAVSLRIEGPPGLVLDREEPLERTQALLFRAAGLRAPAEGWPSGDYRGTARLLRDGAVVEERALTARLP